MTVIECTIVRGLAVFTGGILVIVNNSDLSSSEKLQLRFPRHDSYQRRASIRLPFCPGIVLTAYDPFLYTWGTVFLPPRFSARSQKRFPFLGMESRYLSPPFFAPLRGEMSLPAAAKPEATYPPTGHSRADRISLGFVFVRVPRSRSQRLLNGHSLLRIMGFNRGIFNLPPDVSLTSAVACTGLEGKHSLRRVSDESVALR